MGIWPGHRGYTPILYKKCHGIFNDYRESGPWFNVSSERQCFFDIIVSPSLYWGIRTHADLRPTRDVHSCLFHIKAGSKEEGMIALTCALLHSLNRGDYTAICLDTSKSINTACVVLIS